MIHLANIDYKIGTQSILQGISLNVSPGSFTAILGANGAGKSTLLKILAGDIHHYQGSVKINGNARQTYSHHALAGIRAVLPQASHIQFPYTVLEIVKLGTYALKLAQKESLRLAIKMLEKVGMLSFSHRIYNTLSGGEKQRVQLARVMAQISQADHRPRYLLLDEPTASLDLASQHQILHQAKSLCQENVGVLAILHDLNLASQYADHVLLMKNGKQVAQGPVEEVYTKDHIEYAYEHPVNLEYLPSSGQKYVVPLAPMSCTHHEKKVNQPSNELYHG